MQDKKSSLFLANIKQHLWLTIPILGTQLAQFGMTVADTIVSGKYATSALAGVGLGTSIYTPMVLFLVGITLSASPFIAGAVGSRKLDLIPNITQQTLYLGAFILVAISAAVFGTPFLFEFMNAPPEVAKISYEYLLSLIPGLPGILLFQVMRIVFEAVGRARIALYISVVGLVFNVIANIILVNGLLGFPEFGAVGCGIATSITYWLMAILAYLFTRNYYFLKDIGIFSKLYKLDFSKVKELAGIGFPIGGAIFIEVSLFSTIALFISDFGMVALASHQIAINIGGLIFSLPLSLGMAATILVGTAIGADDLVLARLKSLHALFLSLLVAILMVLIVYTFRYEIVSAYVKSDSPIRPEVVALAVSLLYIALIYQISDAVQVAAAGSLRGYKDTKIVFIITLISYWVVGLGTGHIFGRGILGAPNLGLHGYWLGLAAGLTFAAVFLIWRLIYISKKQIANQVRL